MSKSLVMMLVLIFLTGTVTVVANPVSAADLGSWTVKAPMQEARSDLNVVAVNGKIYAIGGDTREGSWPYTGGIVGTNEEYDPATNKWAFKMPMPTPRNLFGTAVYQNKIYCIGGNTNTFSFTGVTEVYDPKTDSWEIRTSMPTPRHRLDANVVDGKIYLIGGYDRSLPYGGDATDINEVYDPETDTWSTKTPMLARKCDYASAVVGDKIHIIGGYSIVGHTEWNLHQIYDTKADKWSYGAPFPHQILSSEKAGATRGLDAPIRIYVFGKVSHIGESYEYAVRVYDPEDDSWTAGANSPTIRSGFGVGVLDDLFYVIGGVTSDSVPFPLSLYADPPDLSKHTRTEMYTPIGYGTISPKVSIISPENANYTLSEVQLNFTVDRRVEWLGYSLDGQDNVTVSGNTTLAELMNGLHNVTFYALDEFENIGFSQTVYFTVDVPEPQQEPFPTTLVIASVITVSVVGIGLLIYFKKRQKARDNA